MKINKMPTKDTLERFLDGMFSDKETTVYFNIIKGEFIDGQINTQDARSGRDSGK